MAAGHGPAADLGHEARCSSPARSSGKWRGHGIEQGSQPRLVGLGEIAQHPRRDQDLVAGMADPHADPPIVVAEMGVDALQSVVATGTAAFFHADLAGKQIQIVVEDDTCRRDRSC